MSVITNMQILTNEVSLKKNNIPNGQFTINPQCTRRTGKTDDHKYFTELSVSIENTPENPFPYDIHVSITGIFELHDKVESYINQFLEENAVQILFPYIRTIVTSLTTTAMVPPIILPIINPYTLFANQDTKQ